MLRPHSCNSPARADAEDTALPLLCELLQLQNCGQGSPFMSPWITCFVLTNEKLFELWHCNVVEVSLNRLYSGRLPNSPSASYMGQRACKRSVWRTADSITENYHSVRMDDGRRLLPKLLKPCFHFTYRGCSSPLPSPPQYYPCTLSSIKR